MRSVLSLLFLLLLTSSAASQPIELTGTVVAANDDQPLVGVNVLAIPLTDTTRSFGGVTGNDGRFRVELPEAAVYRIRITFIGFDPALRILNISASGRDLNTITLAPRAVRMDDVVIEAVQERVVVNGDTTEYSAAAYKVNPDATAEDLLSKMPGVVVQDGQVEAQGEQVRRVLVDGREFFGDDPTAAIRNLPSEVIEKIQVYERLSDQAQFSGFDDGSGEMTINIITRQDRRNGQFGKVYGGYGSVDRYLSGGNVNVFDGDRRISIIGMSNNVNEQNFSTQDLLGVVGVAGGRGGFGGQRGGGGGRGRGGGGGGFGGDGGGGRGGGGMRVSSNPSNFMVGNQAGVSKTHALGLNYSDQLGERMRMSGSYFFNKSGNDTASLLDREYFLSDTESQFYSETNEAASDNSNHRMTARMTYTVDERNSIIFTPRFSTQSNESASFIFGENAAQEGGMLSRTVNDFLSNTSGFTSSASLLFRHRFSKPGRTISMNLSGGFNDQDGVSDQLSENVYFDASAEDDAFDQRSNNVQSGYNLSTSLTYTEPVGARGQIQVNYRPGFSRSDADRTANLLDPATGTYSILETAQSNTYVNDVTTHRGGLSYRLRAEGAFLTVGLNAQQERLAGDQTFPFESRVDHTFFSLLPQITVQYGDRRSSNLRVSYRTSTNTPSTSQLQAVVDNTNPLQLSSGNPALSPSYSHSFVARYTATNPAAGRVLMGFVSVTTAADYITSETIAAQSETVLDNGIVLAPGSQFTRPLNLDGYWNARSFFTLGRPIELMRSNLNMNAGYSYSSTPSVVNGAANDGDIHVLNGGAVLGSNISERMDFTMSHTTTYNVIRNSLAPELDSNYASHSSSVKLTMMPSRALVLNSTFGYRGYQGLDESVDQLSLLWNAAVGYKFLRGNGGEVRLAVIDILNQQTSVGRTVSSFYVDDTSTNVLGRYVMLNFTYTLRNYRF